MPPFAPLLILVHFEYSWPWKVKGKLHGVPIVAGPPVVTQLTGNPPELDGDTMRSSDKVYKPVE
jgi:hypothetical protein